MRITITTGDTTREVRPKGMHKLSVVEERPQDEVFFRKRLNGSLVLNTASDFSWIRSLELNARCTEFTIKVYTAHCGLEELEYTGRFTISDIRFDFSRCEATIRNIETIDAYTCILKGWEKKVNIQLITAQIPSVTVKPKTENFGQQYEYNLIWGLDFLTVVRHLFAQSGQCNVLPTTDSELSLFFSSDINPVTNSFNYWKDMVVFQASNVTEYVKSQTSNPTYIPELATKGEMTLKQLLSSLSNLYRVKWAIHPTTGKVILEHISYFRYFSYGSTCLSTTNVPTTSNLGKQAYSYRDDKIYSSIVLNLGTNEQFNAKYVDDLADNYDESKPNYLSIHWKYSIDFEDQCLVFVESKENTKLEYNENTFVTDVRAVVENTSAHSDTFKREGWVLCSRRDIGLVAPSTLYYTDRNLPFYLVQNFFLHEMPFLVGKLNGGDQVVIAKEVIDNRELDELTFSSCCVPFNVYSCFNNWSNLSGRLISSTKDLSSGIRTIKLSIPSGRTVSNTIETPQGCTEGCPPLGTVLSSELVILPNAQGVPTLYVREKKADCNCGFVIVDRIYV